MDKVSITNLVGVHPDLVTLFEKVEELSPILFRVTSGVRDIELQKQYYAAGKSQTMKSKHLINKTTGYAHAVDICIMVDGKPNWEPFNYVKFHTIYVNKAIHMLGLNDRISWGGHWKTLRDYCHYQLDI